MNSTKMQCRFNPAVGGTGTNLQCQPYECTYLGSIYVTGTNQVSQQFGPVSGAGGGAPCLCLYNAYNHVLLTSRSADTSSTYTFAGGTGGFLWQRMDASAPGGSKNFVNVVDGLGQMQVVSQVTQSMQNTGKTATIGIDVNPATTPAAPTPIVQTNSASQSSYNAALGATPVLGLWTAQAVEGAKGSTGTASFGGSGLQLLSVQVTD
ncbi:MAG TPA: hypothetical protein VHU18_09010 [Rhizomicrobium sp.]|nr:hypothetical protein [Rhizomicrobium sp.]